MIFNRNNETWEFLILDNKWEFHNTNEHTNIHTNEHKIIAEIISPIRSYQVNRISFSPSGLMMALNCGIYGTRQRETVILDIKDLNNIKTIYSWCDNDEYCYYPRDNYYWEINNIDTNEEIFVHRFRYVFTLINNELVMVNNTHNDSDENYDEYEECLCNCVCNYCKTSTIKLNIKLSRMWKEYRYIKYKRVNNNKIAKVHNNSQELYNNEMELLIDVKGQLLTEWESRNACYIINHNKPEGIEWDKIVKNGWVSKNVFRS